MAIPCIWILIFIQTTRKEVTCTQCKIRVDFFSFFPTYADSPNHKYHLFSKRVVLWCRKIDSTEKAQKGGCGWVGWKTDTHTHTLKMVFVDQNSATHSNSVSLKCALWLSVHRVSSKPDRWYYLVWHSSVTIISLLVHLLCLTINLFDTRTGLALQPNVL